MKHFLSKTSEQNFAIMARIYWNIIYRNSYILYIIEKSDIFLSSEKGKKLAFLDFISIYIKES